MAEKKKTTAAQAIGGLIIWGIIALLVVGYLNSGSGSSTNAVAPASADQAVVSTDTLTPPAVPIENPEPPVYGTALGVFGDKLLIWGTMQGMNSVLQAVKDHKQDQLSEQQVQPLVACEVAQGTLLKVRLWGLVNSTVTVAGGPERGCQGIVRTDWVTEWRHQP